MYETGISWDELSLPSDNLSILPVVNGNESETMKNGYFSSFDASANTTSKEKSPVTRKSTGYSFDTNGSEPYDLSLSIEDLPDADLELEAATLFNCTEPDEIARSILVNTEITRRYEQRGINENNYLNYIDVLLVLTDVYIKSSDFRNACIVKEKALRTQQRISPAESREHKSFLVEFINSIGVLAINAGDLNAAERYFAESNQVALSFAGDFHADYASTLVGLAQVYVRKELYNRSVELLDAAINIYQSTLGSNDKSTLSAKATLASVLNLQAKAAMERSHRLLLESSSSEYANSYYSSFDDVVPYYTDIVDFENSMSNPSKFSAIFLFSKYCNCLM